MKPLIIASFFVAGVKFVSPDLSKLTRGTPVVIELEPTNPHDPTAILLRAAGQLLGHVPREQTIAIHHALSLNLVPQACLAQVDPSQPTHRQLLVQVQVEVTL